MLHWGLRGVLTPNFGLYGGDTGGDSPQVGRYRGIPPG